MDLPPYPFRSYPKILNLNLFSLGILHLGAWSTMLKKYQFVKTWMNKNHHILLTLVWNIFAKAKWEPSRGSILRHQNKVQKKTWHLEIVANIWTTHFQLETTWSSRSPTFETPAIKTFLWILSKVQFTDAGSNARKNLLKHRFFWEKIWDFETLSILHWRCL